ncbi:MAG TPA: rhodanese-like domain-containing protein [Acidimicrobiales bacterium]|nr:rhodanese-like domain-containing protein [Acidimicrobiales bacterium]
MTPEQLAERRHEFQVVDVRWPNEWEAGHIEGSVHVPEDDLDDRLDELDAARPVVTVCRSGHRSERAAEELRAEGFRAENLEGGVLAWAEAGLPLVTPAGTAGEVAEPEPPPDDRPAFDQRLQSEMMSVLMDLQAEFGDRRPSDEEVRGFLRRRMIAEGRSPEEADEVLSRI